LGDASHLFIFHQVRTAVRSKEASVLCTPEYRKKAPKEYFFHRASLDRGITNYCVKASVSVFLCHDLLATKK
jgi:hypothetical protein